MNDQTKLGYEILFIFVAGCIGDLVIHFLCRTTAKWRYKFSPGLLQYYKSLSKYEPLSAVYGALWGGFACVVALLIAKLFMYLHENKYV